MFKGKFSAVLATSSKFCISEQRLTKIWAYATFQARKSEQFDRKCLTSSPRRFSLVLEVGHSSSKVCLTSYAYVRVIYLERGVCNIFTWYRPEDYVYKKTVSFQILKSNATKNSLQLVRTAFPSFFFFLFLYSFFFFSHKKGFFFQGARGTIIGFTARAFPTDINIRARNLL